MNCCLPTINMERLHKLSVSENRYRTLIEQIEESPL